MGRKPESLGKLLQQVLQRRGVGRSLANERFEAAWHEAVGTHWVERTRCGQVKRGVLEVLVISSTAAQELNFQHKRLLARLRQLLPETQIERIRFRVGPID